MFDLWVQERRTQWAYGEVIVVRFADDAVLGFQYRGVAQQFLKDLRQRLALAVVSSHVVHRNSGLTRSSLQRGRQSGGRRSTATGLLSPSDLPRRPDLLVAELFGSRFPPSRCSGVNNVSVQNI